MHAHLSHMFWFCVRSQRIFSEKQFWHVLESSCAAEEPLAGSEASADGGACDMVAKSGAAPHDDNRRSWRERQQRGGWLQIRE